ncbi:MAG: putative sulfoacetate transporter SauU [Syntrophorhabdus sp. PtaU1.Bin058]|nr:MAG: putative sulfoacetate transporter SauU [Syntrophorhabdus sp. PtaU1.Bin058]
MKKGLARLYRYRWYIFAILAVQYLIVYFQRVAPAVVAQELIDAFQISGASLGLLASAYFYPYALTQIPVGILSDSWGPKKTLVVFGSVASFGTIFFGLAPRFEFAFVARAFVGLGVSAVFVSAMRIFAEWYRGIELARISGTLMAIGGLGWFTATTPLAFLSQTFGWRTSFIVTGAVSVVFTVMTWLVVEDRPAKKGLPGIVEHAGNGIPAKRNVSDDLKIILRDRCFWSIAVWFIVRGGALFGFFGLWAGPYLTDVYHLSKNSTGNILSMIAFAMIFLSPVIGHLSDKILMSRKKVLVGTSILNSICWLVMLLFYRTLPIPSLYVLFFLMGITISAVGTIAIIAAKELFPVEISGTSMGTMNLFPFIGGIIFQPLMGYMLDSAGKTQGMYPASAYRMIIWLLFITSLIALASIICSRETMKRQ